MSVQAHFNVVPPLVDAGKSDELAEKGKALSTSLSPLDNSIAIFVTSSSTPNTDRDDSPVYFATPDAAPSSERRLFITDTQIIFAALQNLLKSAHAEESQMIPLENTPAMIHKLSVDYVNFIKECWVHASQPTSGTDAPQYSGDHYRSLYTCFSLFVLLYLPEPGLDNAPIGDELMEWLNMHFIEPSSEEGDHLSALERPWQDESFWPYLVRTTLRGLTKATTFFLSVLSSHPSLDLQDIATNLSPILTSQPRIQQFTTEREFAIASRKWRERVKALRVDMDRIPEENRQDDEDDGESWWERISDIVGILEGRSEVLIRVCTELGADWKEICAAWGVFIDTRLRRQDLAESVVAPTLEDMPADSTNIEDQIHAELLSGDPVKALELAADLDPWLAAHMADVMEAANIIESTQDEETETSLRNHFVLSYAHYLHSDPALWRITVAYMCTCGHIGKATADEILMRVPIQLQESDQGKDRTAQVEGKISHGDVVGVLKEINETCYEYQREDVRRVVCRIAAQNLVRRKEYGLAISYCSSAEDWPSLGRVVDRVLDEYITFGPAQFIQYASTIAPSLPTLRDNAESHSHSRGIFIHRLTFVVRYAQFHQLRMSKEWKNAALDLISMLQDGGCPASWWAVLLYDSVELLRLDQMLFSIPGATQLLLKLQEISTRCLQGSEDDYLGVLMRSSGSGSSKQAMAKLDEVRLLLAKYLARCTMIGVGGKVLFPKH